MEAKEVNQTLTILGWTLASLREELQNSKTLLFIRDESEAPEDENWAEVALVSDPQCKVSVRRIYGDDAVDFHLPPAWNKKAALAWEQVSAFALEHGARVVA